MKPCLSALIPLLASLLVLLTKCNCDGRIRQELEKRNEDKVSDVRKRESSMKFTDHFSASHLEKSCEVCHKLYGINKDDCTKAKKDAKLNCYKKAKDDRSNFMSKWQESASPSAPSAPVAESAPVDKPIHEHHAAGEVEVKSVMKRETGMKLSAHFKGDNLAKSCAVCHTLYEIDVADCEAGKRRAKYNCMLKAKENRESFTAKFHESEAQSQPPLAPESSQSGGGGGAGAGAGGGGAGGGQPETPPPAPVAETPVTPEDFFKPEHVEKTCKVCKVIANVNYDECVKSEENHDNKCCKHAIKTIKDKFDEEWKKNPSIHRAFRKR